MNKYDDYDIAEYIGSCTDEILKRISFLPHESDVLQMLLMLPCQSEENKCFVVQSAVKDRWVCAHCGTEIGRVNLKGLGGDEWSRIPFYCPGCGGKTAWNYAYLDGNVQKVAIKEPK